MPNPVTPRGTDRAKLTQVIVTESLRGAGVDPDACRQVTQYWNPDSGALLAEYDPETGNGSARGQETLAARPREIAAADAEIRKARAIAEAAGSLMFTVRAELLKLDSRRMSKARREALTDAACKLMDGETAIRDGLRGVRS